MQLVFDLGQVPRYCADDYIVSECNAQAVQWVEALPNTWAHCTLIVYGQTGSGKSHLGAIWRDKVHALLLTSDDLVAASAPRALAEQSKNIVLDLGAGFDARTEEPLFHLYNVIKEMGGHLLILARTPPLQWNIKLPDLKSRLCSVPAVEIGLPDEGILGALCLKLFADRQLQVSAPVMSYILSRAERSFVGLCGIVEALDKRSLADKREITVPLVREVLEAVDENAA